MKKRCPKCGSDKIVEIVYGSPQAVTFQRYKKGDVIFGGSFLEELVPNQHCRGCGLDFRIPD